MQARAISGCAGISQVSGTMGGDITVGGASRATCSSSIAQFGVSVRLIMISFDFKLLRVAA